MWPSCLLFLPDFEKLFYKTAAFHEALTFLEKGGRYLFLTGKWGSGKTTLAKNVYTSVTGTPPIIVKDLLQFDVRKNEKPVIFDEAFSTNVSVIQKQLVEKKIKSWCNKIPFIIFILPDSNQYQELITFLPPDENNKRMIDLTNSLTIGDRSQILHAHFQYFFPNKDFSQIEEIISKCNEIYLGYPETYALFCRVKTLQDDTSHLLFCNRPLQHLKLHLQSMLHSKDQDRFCKFLLLVYMSLNEMEIEIHPSNKELNEIIESHKPCAHVKKEEKGKNKKKSIKTEIPDDTVNKESPEASASTSPRLNMSDEFIKSSIPLEFVDKVPDTPNKFRLQHDVIKRMTLIVYGTCHFDKLLEYAKPEDLEGWIEKENIRSPVGEIKPVLKVSDKQWKTYEQKCVNHPP